MVVGLPRLGLTYRRLKAFAYITVNGYSAAIMEDMIGQLCIFFFFAASNPASQSASIHIPPFLASPQPDSRTSRRYVLTGTTNPEIAANFYA